MSPVDYVLFAVLPYTAVFIAVVGGIYRFVINPFSYSSLSSQFLENKKLFWGAVPWHFGILVILLAHLIAFLMPGPWRALLSNIDILYTLEVIGLSLALAALVGILAFAVRRLVNSRILAITSVMDWVLLIALIVQVSFGFYVALYYRWGADWYMDTSVPWIASLLKFNPQLQYVVDLPLAVKFHMLFGFVIIGLFPFTRLVHIVALPIQYLWRPLQVVIWNKRTKEAVSDKR